jgi:hypothetical protein
MSETEIYMVNLEGDVHHHIGIRNSWHGAMNVWNELARAYFGWENFPLINYEGRDGQQVWDLYKDEKVPLNIRIVLMSTFDKVMVKRENLERLATAMEEFASQYLSGSLMVQARILRELAEDENCLAVCWNQTSVSYPPWYIWDDDDDEKDRVYNINTDKIHWFLFEELKE